ncbi:short chain dehydrogenase/reductase [Xylaria grammica]|nr:short chain dehydrogenase/reductase [Xylaria grammica]
MDSFNAFTSTLGTSLVLYVSYKLLDTARLYLRPSSLHRYRYTDASGQHSWALVTGSSSGIGKCLAFELADHGFNIVLHGRNPSKLEAVRDELQATAPNTEVRILVADASQCHRPEAVDFERIRDELASLHLTVLINCAGAGAIPAFGALETYGRDVILDNLHLNAAFSPLLTAALLPVLRGQYKKPTEDLRNGAVAEEPPAGPRPRGRPALVINIGSVTDDGFPLVSFYSAGKAASHTLHKALAREAALGGWSDVEIVSHRIGAVTGVSHTQAPPTLFRPDARTVAKAILARTGCGRKSVVPYWPHALLQVFLGALPVSMVDRTINKAMRRVQDEEAKKKE